MHKVSIDTGLSDWHHMVCVSTKIHVPIRKKNTVTYRSYQHFDENDFNRDLEFTPFHVSEIFDEIDDACFMYQRSFFKIDDAC